MAKRLGLWLAMGAVATCLVVPTAHAGEPAVGLSVGAAFPLSKFKKTVDTGGAIAPWVGYGWGDKLKLTLVGEPGFTFFPTDDSAKGSGDLSSLFSFTAGPRVSLADGDLELFFAAQGGVFTEISGPPKFTSGGFNTTGGINYELARGTALGVNVRYTWIDTDAAATSSSNLTFLTTGLEVRHRFLAPEPIAAAAPAPPPAPVVAAPAKKKIVLRGVNFDFDKAAIRADAKPILDEAAATLTEAGSVTVLVEGHTDNIGTDAYNDQLSLRRADAVRGYLTSHGVDAKRLTVKGLGESHPVADNKTRDGRAQNRRVELLVNE